MKKLAALILLVSLFALVGCGREEVPFNAKHFEVQEQITAVTLDVRDRKIDVVPSQDGKVRIDYCDSEKEFFDIRVTDGLLTMTADHDKAWEDYIGKNARPEDRTITLYLPDLSALTVATTNEDITLPAIKAGEISLAVVNGNIRFEELDVEKALDLDAKNGSITGRILGGYDDFAISCTTKKGSCNLPETKSGGEKTLTVIANNGDVEIEFVK